MVQKMATYLEEKKAQYLGLEKDLHLPPLMVSHLVAMSVDLKVYEMV